ncbi:MAG: galactose mutarotase [Kiritimatiellae bacterium]|nr:galactose mutarotase [Kiritimatiellia bacterium]
MKNSIEKVAWGSFEGEEAHLWRLVNANGMELDITDFGGRLVRALVPDREGHFDNVTLGWETLDEYVGEHGGTYYGALVGRYGNRIGKGRFTLDGVEHVLELNNEPNGIPCALHGGLRGFSLRMWRCVEEIHTDDMVGIVLEIDSPDGEGGYPGNVTVRATLILDNRNAWHVGWRAETDRATPLSFTDHAYWNLDGIDAGSTVMGHLLYVNADQFTPYGPDMIPTGELRDVAGTPFDFRTTHAVGEHHGDDCAELKYGMGYDINWALRRDAGDELSLAAILTSPATGRQLEVWTTEPGLQIYDGYYLPVRNSGIALETQHFPDSPNKPMFPNTILHPGQVLYSTTEFRFKTV